MNRRLKSLAYRMLGSVADAEDVLQEAMLRLHEQSQPPKNEEAFLYRVVSNLCIDKLRQERRRKTYVGPWLPEPWVEEDPDVVEMAEQLSMGFMLMLEQLSPKERAVYVLREGFDYSYAEIAGILNVSPAAARQQAHRARERIKPTQLPPAEPASEQKRLLDAMLASVAAGNIDDVVQLLSEDVVVYADGGGVVSAAIAPVFDRARIAQVTMHLMAKTQAAGPMQFDYRPMNGGWGVVIAQAGAVHSAIQISTRNGLINAMYVVRNPHKLQKLMEA